MPLSKHAQDLLDWGQRDIRRRIAEEWREFEKRTNPSVAQSMWPNLKSESERKDEEEGEMQMAKTNRLSKGGPGGGYGSKTVKHGKSGKAEPKPRAISPAAVNQLGAKVGDHVMGKGGRDTGYRGEALVRGKGYSPPVGPSDNVKAVGVGGGRTVMKSGSQQGLQPARPNPTTRDTLAEFGPEAVRRK